MTRPTRFLGWWAVAMLCGLGTTGCSSTALGPRDVLEPVTPTEVAAPAELDPTAVLDPTAELESTPEPDDAEGATAEATESQGVIPVSARVETAAAAPNTARIAQVVPVSATSGPGRLAGGDFDVPAASSHWPIDLPTALEWAAGQNPAVGFARQRTQEAFADLAAANTMWVPSLRIGANYNKHEGRIQDVAGEMIETSRGSIYGGFGSQTVGAGSPGVPGLLMEFHLRDAIFQPRIAQHAVRARRFESQAAVNDTLLETALSYTDLLEALQVQAIADETRDNASELAELADSYAETGQGLAADSDRARTERLMREIEVRRAGEQVQVARVRLTRQLSHDQHLELMPIEPALVPIEMIDPGRPLPELIATGLAQRPELAENRALVNEAVERLRREKTAPLVPSVLLGMSYGGNAGGLGGDLINFGDRLDLDAAAFWEIRNFGFGEKAARDQARARLQQVRWQQVRVLDAVAAEVAEAHAQVEFRRSQVELAQLGVATARDSLRRNLERIQDAKGLPLEALQSIQALDQAQRTYAQAVADYNRAQFRLHWALGCPVGR